MLHRAFLSAALVIVALGLAACGSGTLSGSVVAGPASLVTSLRKDDPRLAPHGIAGVALRVIARRSAHQDRHLASVTTDEEGRFACELRDLAGGEQLVIEASKEAHVPAKGTLYPPGPDHRVLVVLKPVEPAR
jgi:hypothetical protein